MNLLDACLCFNVFKKIFCNPSITASSDQILIGWSCLSTFLVYHSSASPLNLVPKYSTWKSVLSLPKRPFSLNYRSIPAMKVSYTLRSGLPEYSSGDGIFNFVFMTIESLGIISRFSVSIIFTIQCIGSLGQWLFVDTTDAVFALGCQIFSGGSGMCLAFMVYSSVCLSSAGLISGKVFPLFRTFT